MACFFSIIVPTHNRPDLLDRALKSVDEQRKSFANFELIVVNDGSSEPYSKVLSSYDHLISIYIELETSGGVSAARNTAIKRASGQWIVFLDDDDEFCIDSMLHLHRTILGAQHTNIGFFWSNVELLKYDAFGSVVKRTVLDYSRIPSHYLLDAAATIGASYGVAINKDLFDYFGYFDESLSVGEDTDLILKFLSGGVKPAVNPFIAVRKHDHSGERLTASMLRYSKDMIYEKIFDRYQEFLFKHPSLYCSGLKFSMLIHFKNRNFKAFFSAMKKSSVQEFRKVKQKLIGYV